MNQSDILSLGEEDSKIVSDVEKRLQENKIPLEYGCEVKLSTGGKLSAPKVLHFRNYTMKELFNLSSNMNERFIESLVGCLNNMVFEEFDCSQLHERELEEVMIYIYATYWDKFFEAPYYEDETLTGEAKTSDENTKVAKIDLSKLVINGLPKEFIDPISITPEKGITVKFTLPRIRNLIVAQRYIEEKMYDDEFEMSDVEYQLEKNKSLPQNQRKKFPLETIRAYKDFQAKKNQLQLSVFQAQFLVEYDGKKLETIQDKIEAFDKIDLHYWRAYNDFVEEKLNFGIDKNITFKEDGVNKTRRFMFQSMDFLPSVDKQGESVRYNIQFG